MMNQRQAELRVRDASCPIYSKVVQGLGCDPHLLESIRVVEGMMHVLQS